MWDNADALAGSGASLTLEEDQRDAVAISGAIERLLKEPAFSTAARRVAAEIATLPHPDEYVPASRLSCTAEYPHCMRDAQQERALAQFQGPGAFR